MSAACDSLRVEIGSAGMGAQKRKLRFEGLLVNALVHRDYLISAPIRLFIFDDRIGIISPGTLPNISPSRTSARAT